jgi:hypothetical protein
MKQNENKRQNTFAFKLFTWRFEYRFQLLHRGILENRFGKAFQATTIYRNEHRRLSESTSVYPSLGLRILLVFLRLKHVRNSDEARTLARIIDLNIGQFRVLKTKEMSAHEAAIARIVAISQWKPNRKRQNVVKPTPLYWA